jgi:hypothetical protein
VCKACYLDRGGSIEEWNRLNEEAKAIREAKKRGEIPSRPYNSSSNSKKPPEPKECKYKCGKMLVWDYKLDSSNKFKEVDTDIPHTYVRCADLRKEKGLSMDVYKKK